MTPDPKFFELNNDKKKDVWHSLNIEDFNKKFNLNLMPYLIYEQNHDYKEEKKAVVPNIISKVNHLNYAFTWYFLGLTMCVIFSLYFKKAFN